MTKKFKQVDVFSKLKYKGNPVAVFFDADDLSHEDMLQMAKWTNLSETTFVLKPTTPMASYRVRIFTPVCELDFAGHPTIGTCFGLLELGLIPPNAEGNFIQECKSGLVELKPIGDLNNLETLKLRFKLPSFKIMELDNRGAILKELSKALGNISLESIITEPVLIDNGPKWVAIQLKTNQHVIDVIPDTKYLKEISRKYGWTGTSVFGKNPDSNDTFELRNFAPMVDCDEDPACGSGAASVGVYLRFFLESQHSILRLSQGRKILRDAELVVHIEGKDIYVVGASVTCLSGTYS